MTQETPQDHIAKKRVVYEMPGVDAVTKRPDVDFGSRDGDAITMDVYYPPDFKAGARLPAVIVVAGFPDLGFQRVVGCKFKEMGSSVSWARLIAASGMVAITYSNREPAADVHTLVQYVRKNGASLGVDESRIGLWASSGNVPLALSLLMQDSATPLKCAILCYGYMLDHEGSTGVADAAKNFGFANPCAGKSVEDLRRDIPLFLARAGNDQMPHLNETLDRFVVEAFGRDLPLTLVNYASAPHAFDLFQDTETSREIVRQILAFLRFHLQSSLQG
jgi:acetyl esterase/lipase